MQAQTLEVQLSPSLYNGGYHISCYDVASVSLFQSVNAPLSIRAFANSAITFFTGATNTEKVRITNAGEVVKTTYVTNN